MKNNEVWSLYKFESPRMIIRAGSMAEALDMWRVKMEYNDKAEPSSIKCIGDEIDRPNIFE